MKLRDFFGHKVDHYCIVDEYRLYQYRSNAYVSEDFTDRDEAEQACNEFRNEDHRMYYVVMVPGSCRNINECKVIINGKLSSFNTFMNMVDGIDDGVNYESK